MDGYDSIHLGRKNKRGGGICLYVHNSLSFKTRNDLSIINEDIENLCIEIINKKTKNIIVNTCYKLKVVNITYVMIKLQFKLPKALISRGFTRRTVFHAPAFQQKGINRLMDIYQIWKPKL